MSGAGAVLALDTATSFTSVAVLADGRVESEFRALGTDGRPQHSTWLLDGVQQVLERSGLGYGDISTVAVGLGPGSFTGVRVGVAAARGIASGLGIDIVGAGTLRALIHARSSEGRPVAAIVDARRREAFVQVRPAGSAEPGPPSIMPLDGVAAALPPGALCVGDGALLLAERLGSAGHELPEATAPAHGDVAASVARLAADPDASGVGVLPLYLRRPDAIPTAEREGR